MDWVAWHADYDSDTPLRRRLAMVQRHIVRFLDESTASPVRVVSMCAGEARDLLGAVAEHERRDLVGRLVEIDSSIAALARHECDRLGLTGIEVAVGDAGASGSYAGVVPADLVLACGVFGNISDSDVERTVRAFPQLCATGATVIWTRHRREPDLTPSIRRWLAESGLDEVSFENVQDSPGSVGVARFAGVTPKLIDQRLFTFTRTDVNRDGRWAQADEGST